MYEKLQQLAVKDGARTHHISQKVEVSPTVIKLVQFALDTLAGILPDNSENIPDSLSDILLNKLSDKTVSVSDISDKRVEGIVDRRLKELGLFPECQTSENPASISIEAIYPPLSDKLESVPDNLPDNDVIISDNGALLPDSLPDTKNIPSDDSSNSESIAEDVQVIPTDAIEQVSGDIPSSFSFGEFHDWLGLTRTARNKVNGDTAIDFARSQGRGNWAMSKSYKFTIQTENN
ncbi:hypothetical protein [Chamaesiphon sp.]|uniref:hypothetical protein n=1 Tax=Chamaesiphon sp. TaxID=2814140 RepID=UPI003592E8A2